jgi:hypothetical protein
MKFTTLSTAAIAAVLATANATDGVRSRYIDYLLVPVTI